MTPTQSFVFCHLRVELLSLFVLLPGVCVWVRVWFVFLFFDPYAPGGCKLEKLMLVEQSYKIQ